MFDALSSRLEALATKLRGRGRLTQADVDEALREIRTALLEADVHVVVVRNLVARIRERCVGTELLGSLSPGQQVVRAVRDELREVLGGEALRLTYAPRPPTVVLLAGLQGSGKTTTAAKLALWFKRQGRSPLLVGADLQRPAAVEQLAILARQAGVPMYSEPTDPVSVAQAGVMEASRRLRDVVVVDTAGRLAVDDELMAEVAAIRDAVSPRYTFLVIDAMVGQDAVATASAFHERLALDGLIVTKLDGDARGGAVLSAREVVGRPVVFASTGERLENFDLFHPDRMADRILGMGDVLSLIEAAERTMDLEVAERGATRLKEGRFSLQDLVDQMRQLRRMGPLKGIIGMLPGLPPELKNADIDESRLVRIEAIVSSMTPEERDNPNIIDASRRLRIARGAGVETAEVSRLVREFNEMQKAMRALGLGAGRAKKQKTKKAGRSSGRMRSGR
jgi:signal recognition particle subunit SRP54